jgi:hypothetical protein
MTVELHNPGNTAPIDELYAFMSIDADGNHGLLAHILPGLGSTPLVTGSAKAAEGLKPLAREIGKRAGMRVGLFVFKRGAGMVWSGDQ